jgi:hypothetical protein
MPTKASEKKLLLSALLFISAAYFLVYTKVFNAPVQISEKGILFIFLAAFLLIASIKLLKRTFIKY